MATWHSGLALVIFYQRDRTTPAYVNANNAPFSVSNTFTRTLDTPPTNILGGGASPSGGYDPSNLVSNSLQWNLTYELAVPKMGKNTTLEVGYVGNHAVHQLNDYNVNPVPQSMWIARFIHGQSEPTADLSGLGNYGLVAEQWQRVVQRFAGVV